MFRIIKEKIEKIDKIDFSWFKRYKTRTAVFVGLNLLLFILSRLPYFNLVLNGQILVLIPIILVIIVFNLAAKTVIKFTALIFLITFASAFILGTSVAEILGNYAYVFLFLAVFKMAVNLFSDND